MVRQYKPHINWDTNEMFCEGSGGGTIDLLQDSSQIPSISTVRVVTSQVDPVVQGSSLSITSTSLVASIVRVPNDECIGTHNVICVAGKTRKRRRNRNRRYKHKRQKKPKEHIVHPMSTPQTDSPIHLPIETGQLFSKDPRLLMVSFSNSSTPIDNLSRRGCHAEDFHYMWMQTLPSIAQANILGFLSAEHTMFHAKDLELLALDLLSGGRQDLWVAHGAQRLLSKVGCSNKLIEGKDLKWFHTLPSWLLEYKSQPPVLPWMPATLLLETSTKDQTCGSAAEEIRAGLGKSKYIQADDAPNMDGPVHQGRWHENKEIRQDTEDEFIGLQTPPHHSEGGKRTLEELVLSTASLTALQDEGQNFNTSMKATRVGSEQKVEQQSPLPSEGEGSLTYALAVSFREAWLDRQPTLEDLHNFSTLPDTCAFLKLLKPWEMKDETLLGMTKVFIKNDSGFAWSAKILSYCLLPKMLQLEQPASRFLVSAGIEAAELHPRAVVDALLIPLVLSEKGPTKAQCDVINRMLKECLSDDHALSFCAKIFLSNRRQQLPFENPPFAQKDFLSKSFVWSEPAWTILQNILSRSILLDEELLEVLVNGCGEEVARFAKSLKFSNLLLCLLSRLGLRLKPYKRMFQRIAEQTETFMTKSLITKSASL